MRTNFTFKGKVYQSGKVMKRTDPRGRTVVRMNFVNFDNYRNGAGEDVSTPHFIPTVAFGAVADSLLSRIKSGSYVEVEGVVRTSRYNDRTQVDLVLIRFDLLNDKSQDPLVFFTTEAPGVSDTNSNEESVTDSVSMDDDIPF